MDTTIDEMNRSADCRKLRKGAMVRLRNDAMKDSKSLLKKISGGMQKKETVLDSKKMPLDREKGPAVHGSGMMN